MCALLLFSATISKSQQYTNILDSVIKYPDLTQILLPLSDLIDSAQLNSPMLKFYDADVIIKRLKVKSEQRNWMQHMGLEGGVKYGLLDNLVYSSSTGIVTPNLNSETRYSLGVYLKIPIYSFLDKSSVKWSKQEVIQSELLHERTLQELRQLVIIQYNNLIKSHRLLIVRANHVATYSVQMLRAERDFIEGNIPIAEYARLNEMFTNAEINLEDNKVEFNTALQLLQETVGIKIELKF